MKSLSDVLFTSITRPSQSQLNHYLTSIYTIYLKHFSVSIADSPALRIGQNAQAIMHSVSKSVVECQAERRKESYSLCDCTLLEKL